MIQHIRKPISVKKFQRIKLKGKNGHFRWPSHGNAISPLQRNVKRHINIAQNKIEKAKRSEKIFSPKKRSEQKSEVKRTFFFKLSIAKRREKKAKRRGKIEAKRREESFRTKFFGQFLRIKNMTRSSKNEIVIYASFMIFPKISPHFDSQPWI